MSSTEQKNVTQPFVDHCHAFGILPTILCNAFANYPLDTHVTPFEGLGRTDDLGDRLTKSDEPMHLARSLFPVVANAKCSSRLAPFILRVTADAKVYVGNQAVNRFVHGLAMRRWCLHFVDSHSVRHAVRNVGKVCSLLSPASYGQVERTDGNIRRIGYKGHSYYLRNAADIIELLRVAPHHGYHARHIRQWCLDHRKHVSIKPMYRKESAAYQAYCNFQASGIYNSESPPTIRQRWIRSSKKSPFDVQIHHVSGHYYFKFIHKHALNRGCHLSSKSDGTKPPEVPKHVKSDHELYIFSDRDMRDIQFLLHACAQIRVYHDRRLWDIVSKVERESVKCLQNYMWSSYMEVMRYCGEDFKLRNKLGVYFDVLQWRYLAWRSGDLFYNHSSIMEQKITSKGLKTMPDQGFLLNKLIEAPMDVSVDLLGMYKASVYPEVDPFKVVGDQYNLHMSRFNTDWVPGSKEAMRFEETKAYMWYLGIHVIHNRYNRWPGRIREGVESRSWHERYHISGIPSSDWRHARDVDLTGAMVVTEITDDMYMRQQDSACAPPLWHEYESYDSMRKAPRYHRRKLLYAIQETRLPSLSRILNQLNELGTHLPEGYVGSVDFHPEFSTDIVTGSRCERHKDAPRPFYAASPPWGCILSYFDGITRDFLNNVPQSMLGKSTRQKFMDLKAVTDLRPHEFDVFYMSDDKAKYSPRMDPRSQQLPADFFAEVFNIPGMKAYGPVMYHSELYYRVAGHLVHYNSNGTDREGMRGASNTWLEIVAQGLSTRLCRERKLVRGKSTFLSFIDDGLRKFAIDTREHTGTQSLLAARQVIEDVIFGLKVLGRELSWDKTFISRDLFVMLNEIVYDGSYISSGLKSYCTAGDIEQKEVMSAADYEQLYFGKMRGAHGVGAPLDLCHYTYVFDTLMSHYRMGVNLQDNRQTSTFDYRLFCITPLALGGGGVRSSIQMSCNEVANATKEGIGNLVRLGAAFPLYKSSVDLIVHQPIAELSPVDFMREPEQFHVEGPRIRSQRVVAEVRNNLRGLASNDMSRAYVEQDSAGMQLLSSMGKAYMSMGSVSAGEIRLVYAASPVAFIDEFVQKLASSKTLSELLPLGIVKALRRRVRNDLKYAVEYFRHRCQSEGLLKALHQYVDVLAYYHDFLF